MTDQRKQKVDARSLVARLSKEGAALREREIIAPLLPGGRIRTRVSGMVHEFRLKGEFVGWGRFRPSNEREVELLGEAQPWERGAYLELFPLLRVVLLWPQEQPPGTWLALPFNESDARQRFGLGNEPIPVLLCDPLNGAERFERVLTRVDGRTIWFEGPDTLSDPLHGEWLRDAATRTEEQDDPLLKGLAGSERLALLYWHIRETEQVARQQPRPVAETSVPEVEQGRNLAQRTRDYHRTRAWMRQQAQHATLEDSLRHELALADAVLHSYSEIAGSNGRPAQIVVEWSERGQTYRYRSTIDARLNVVSSGICLSGRDRDFDLASLVSVMTDSDRYD